MKHLSNKSLEELLQMFKSLHAYGLGICRANRPSDVKFWECLEQLNDRITEIKTILIHRRNQGDIDNNPAITWK